MLPFNILGGFMRVIVYFVFLFFTAGTKLKAETFAGHIQFQVYYSKEYKNGPLPYEHKVDFYLKDHLKLIMVEATFSKKKVVNGYLFDDNKKVLTQINYIDKTFTPIPYDMIPANSYSTDLSIKKEPRYLLSRKLKWKHLIDKIKNLHYEAWYSDLTTKPFGIYKIDVAHIVEEKSGEIALLLVREVKPGTKVIYKAVKIEKIDPTKYLNLPVGYKFSKQAVEK